MARIVTTIDHVASDKRVGMTLSEIIDFAKECKALLNDEGQQQEVKARTGMRGQIVRLTAQVTVDVETYQRTLKQHTIPESR